MKQRVNLQYSIDIEQLPRETHRLFLSAHKYLSESLEIISAADESDTDVLTVEYLNTIDRIRTSMMNADYVLSDVQNIIKGYLGHISSENTEEENSQESLVPYQANQEINFDDLEEKLKLFQNNFEKENDADPSQELSD